MRERRRIQKRTIKFSTIYSDIVDQIFQMSLVARNLWLSDSKARKVFENLHSGYGELANLQQLSTLTPHEFSLFYLKAKYGNSADASFDPSVPRWFVKKDSYTETAYKILRDVCDILDKKKSLTEEFPQDLKKLTVSAFKDTQFLDDTFGYGHENLYLCLFHFEKFFKYCFLSKFEGEETLHDAKDWMEMILRPFNCKRKTRNWIEVTEEKVKPNSLEFKHDPKSSPTIKLKYDKEQYELLKNSRDKQKINQAINRATKLCELLFTYDMNDIDWRDREKYLSEGLSLVDPIVLFEADYIEFEKFRQRRLSKPGEQKEDITYPLVLKRVDAAQTIAFAILAFDYYKGPLKFAKKVTIEQAVLKSKEMHWKQVEEEYPKSGVRKQLNSILKSIKSNEYSINQTKVKHEGYSGPYFSFPFFRFIEEEHTGLQLF